MNPALLSLVLAGSAQAGDTFTHIDAGLYTDFPASVGARGTVELPNRVRFSVGAGAFPSAYLGTIQSVATSAGWYSEELATLIDTALSKAFLMRFQAGWRPIEDKGFFFTGGYMPVMAVGGDAEATEMSAAIENAESGYHLTSRLQMATIEAGWEWVVNDKLVIRSSLGGAFTLGAQTEATEAVDSDTPFERARAVGREVVEEYLDETYTQYVHTPTVGVEVGWRFR
mgnify:CR=1 FL=1